MDFLQFIIIYVEVIMRSLVLILILSMVFSLYAEKFISEYTYNAGEMDSKVTSRTFATEQVKKQVLEQIGMFVSTEVVNYSAEANGVLKEMTSSEISVIAAGVVSFSILDESWNGVQYWIKAQVEADPNDVIKALNALVDKKEKIKELRETQARAEAALAEAENLRRELKKTKDELEMTKLQAVYVSTSNTVAAKDWLQKAYASVRAENYDEAMQFYTKAIENDPALAPAYAGMGNISQYRNQIDTAIAYYEKATINGSKSIFTYLALGGIYMDRKLYDKAIEVYKAGMKVDPELWTFNMRLATIHYERNEKAKALAELDIAIQKHGNFNPEANNFKGQIYLEHKEWDKAIDCYNSALKASLAVDFVRSYVGLGYAYTQKNDLLKAIDYLEKGKKLDASSEIVLSNLGWAYYLKKDYQKTIDNMDILVKQGKKDANLLLIIGACYSELNKPDLALNYLNNAHSIDPNNKEVLNGIGWAYYQKNDYAAATQWYLKAIAVDANFAEPYYNLGLVYEKQGNASRSKENLQKAAQMNHEKAKSKLQQK